MTLGEGVIKKIKKWKILTKYMTKRDQSISLVIKSTSLFMPDHLMLKFRRFFDDPLPQGHLALP